MKRTDTEIAELLRRAAPPASPIDSVRVARVLTVALASRRKSASWWGLWRGLGVAATCAVAAFAFWTNTRSAIAPVAVPVAVPVAKAAPTKPRRVLPAHLPKPTTPPVMLARADAPALPVAPRRFRRRVRAVATLPKPIVVAPTRPMEPTPTESEPLLYVAASSLLPGEPEPGAEQSLTVTVTHDVPDTVPGRAEAAAVQVLNIESAGEIGGEPSPQAVPVWTHARIETGCEPVLTVTAL